MNPPLDYKRIEQLVGPDKTLIDALLRMFVQDLHEHRRQLLALSGSNDDLKEYQRLLHRLIGASCYLAADDLHAALNHAEKLSRQHNATHFMPALTAVYHEIERILESEDRGQKTEGR